jgi:asparagine synthase (glutamine-hydrolysing)
MCGICGEINFRGKPVDRRHLEEMTAALFHRGPDDGGIYCQGSTGLGHRRLSIIDLSSSGRQPMWSNDGSLGIVFNGEVYNFQELRRELTAKGYHFHSTSDTEVVVNAIHCWGMERALSRFTGMFALAVWDKRTRQLFLARDRQGIKPLFYFLTGERLLFASEVKALLCHPDFPKELNMVALGQYFITGYFLGNHTVFNRTWRVPPGHYLAVDHQGTLSTHRYWGLEAIQRNSFQGTFQEAAERLEDILEQAFRHRLVADVPVGLFLSGGIDSAMLAAILKHRVKADLIHITIGFNEAAYDETPKARQVAQELGVKHLVQYIDVEEAQNTLLKFCEIYDEPFGDTSGIPTYILSRLARQQVKVALSADGGDEQFCGYEAYDVYPKNYLRLKRVPWILRRLLSQAMTGLVPYRRLLSLKGNKQVLLQPQAIAKYEKMAEFLKVRTLGDLLRTMYEKAWSISNISELLPVAPGALFAETGFGDFTREGREEICDAMMRQDYQIFLGDDILVKVDRASMYTSLECRDPFLDHHIAEFAFSLPVKFLFDGEHKKILKSILRRYLSEGIVSSPKRGFSIPLYYWLKGIWKPTVMEYLAPERVKAVGVLDPGKVGREVALFYQYNGCRAEKIWMMLNFQMWAERWYLGRPVTSAINN